MIQKLTSLNPYMDFIREINSDPVFSDPMLSTQENMSANLYRAVGKPDNHALGVFRDGVMTGLFVFLIIIGKVFQLSVLNNCIHSSFCVRKLRGFNRSFVLYKNLNIRIA